MQEKIESIDLEFLRIEDYEELKDVMITSYHTMPESYWKAHHVKSLIEKFPEGQIVIKINGKIAGCALSIIVNYSKYEYKHTYREITGNYSFDTHTSDGDVLYGIDVFITPDFRGNRLGRRLYEYRKELCEKLNLKGIVFGGRIPNFHKFADQMSPKEYIEKVKNREIHDPVLNFQLSNDFHPIRVLKGYLEGDEASMEYAVLLEWDNIYYEKPSDSIRVVKKIIRLGIGSMADETLQNLD
jgi:GNAT superfamily N-acetyltransferase